MWLGHDIHTCKIAYPPPPPDQKVVKIYMLKAKSQADNLQDPINGKSLYEASQEPPKDNTTSVPPPTKAPPPVTSLKDPSSSVHIHDYD